MIKKLRYLLVLVALSTCLCLMSNTYSRYVATNTSNVEVLFSKWQILVNSTDITDGSSSEIEFSPVVVANDNVKADTIAPSSQGYFDISIDPSNVEVSFSYEITLSIENENVPDLLITEYAILPEGYIEGDPLTPITIVGGVISDSLYFDNETADFTFDAIDIRVYFEWYEGDGESMDDAADTMVGLDAATNGTTFTMSADIQFEQIFE